MKRALVVLALLVTAAGPLRAQTIDLTPRIGAYVPLVNLIEGTDPLTGLAREQKAVTKFTIGGRLGVWLGNSFGVEGVVDYNTGPVQTFVGGVRQSPNISSHLFAASIRPMLRLNSPSGNVALVVSAGGGLVDRGGTFTSGLTSGNQFTGRTDPAGAAGLGLLIKLNRHVAARIDVDGYTYTAQYRNAAAGNTSALRQYDLFITFGLTGPFRNYGIPGE
ncbi:MAG: hypothetical protein ACREOC_18245 [Gemmatimonadales bacterium]